MQQTRMIARPATFADIDLLHKTYGKDILNSSKQQDLLQASEYASRRVQLSDRFPRFEVDFDFKASLGQVVKNISDEDVVLPFDTTTFVLNYRETPIVVVVGQNLKTFELMVFSVNPLNRVPRKTVPIRSLGESEARIQDNSLMKAIIDGTVKPNQIGQSISGFKMPAKAIMGTRTDFAYMDHRSMYLEEDEKQEILSEIRYVCMAMEAKIATKTAELIQGMAAKMQQTPRDIYRVTVVKPLDIVKRKNAEPKYHHRFHIRRAHWKGVGAKRKRIGWYFAGDISLGVITKDYDATKDTLGTP